jgi:hypothetical protein
MPGFISTTVRCAKDLKPNISRRFKRIRIFYLGNFGAINNPVNLPAILP